MIKCIVCTIILQICLFNFTAPAQIVEEANKKRIIWTEAYKLQWSDFKAKPDYNDRRIAAITASLIQYSYHCKNGQINFSSSAIFVCNESWVKSENKNKATLEHEQLHFDITEFYNRILQKKVYSKKWSCNEIEDLEYLINDTLAEWRSAQVRYDTDTWYSLNAFMQNEWNNTVREYLENE